MKDMVVITGSSGLIGHRLCERLCAADYRVIGMDRPGAPYPSRAESVNVNLTSEESVKHALEELRNRHGSHISSFIHLAAARDFSPATPYEEVSVLGTERLLRGLRNFYVDQFLFTSMMQVHAPCTPGQAINEDWPLDPRWEEPESKARAEELLRSAHGNIPLVILRIAEVYNELCHSVPLSRQIQRIYEKHPARRYFPGHYSHGQSFLHLEDLLDAFELLVGKRSSLPQELTLLLGEEETVNYDELQHRFAGMIHGESLHTVQIPKILAKILVAVRDALPFLKKPFLQPWMMDIADHHYALDISRAKRLLGWSPKHSLRNTIPEMVACFKTNTRGWYNNNGLEVPSWVGNRSGLRDRRVRSKPAAADDRRGDRKDRRSQEQGEGRP